MAHDLPQTADLAAFIAVIEDGGFAEAGRRLGAAPSTLSRTVTRLEARLKVTLLRRSTRGIELTPEGRDLLEAAREIVGRTEALSDLATGARAPRGPLRINAPVPFVLHVIAPRLAKFHALYPEIGLNVDMTGGRSGVWSPRRTILRGRGIQSALRIWRRWSRCGSPPLRISTFSGFTAWRTPSLRASR